MPTADPHRHVDKMTEISTSDKTIDLESLRCRLETLIVMLATCSAMPSVSASLRLQMAWYSRMRTQTADPMVRVCMSPLPLASGLPI